MNKQLASPKARAALDRRLAALNVSAISPAPRGGWVRAIRDALGMTSRQLAERMGVAQPTVSSLERAEVRGVIQLDTLRRAAEALQCDVVYALVPRVGLDDIVARQAHAQAHRRIVPVNHTMRLEDQALDDDDLRARQSHWATFLVDTPRLWDSPIE